MLFSDETDTKTVIIYTLSQGSVSSIKLQEQISKKQKITKQAFYKALRQLIKEEIIIKNKHVVMLNNSWIKRLQEFIESTDNTYTLKKDDLFGLKDGESIVHDFRNLSSLNKLWMHYFFIAVKAYPSENIIFYNRHNFWMLFRHEAENFMFTWISNHAPKAYLIIGNDTPLDRSTVKKIKYSNVETHFEQYSSFEKHHYSLAVIGDYVIDTTLDNATVNAIDNLYKKHSQWNEAAAKELNIIMNQLKRSKISIKKDKKKATQIKKKLLNYFIFF